MESKSGPGAGGAGGRDVTASQPSGLAPAQPAPSAAAAGTTPPAAAGTTPPAAAAAQAGVPAAQEAGAGATGGLPCTAASGGGPLVRASDRERDDVVRKLQEAFAEGRLGDEEFDERMRTALVARTRADLDQLLSDLPAQGSPRQVAAAADWPAEGRFAIAIKGSVRRGGRWRVPDRMTTIAYKGSSHIDLRAAELTAPVTAIRAVGYKSDVEIVVPPGVRVVTSGMGVSRGLPGDEQESDLAPDAPVLHVRGFAYKGRIEIRSKPRPR